MDDDVTYAKLQPIIGRTAGPRFGKPGCKMLQRRSGLIDQGQKMRVAAMQAA